MKKILVPVNFSAAAENAACYALVLAKSIGASVELIHICTPLVENLQAGTFGWPMEAYQNQEEQSTQELRNLTKKIAVSVNAQYNMQSRLPIDTHTAMGGITDQIKERFHQAGMNLVVMGVTKSGSLARMLSGSTVKQTISNCNVPLLLVPEGTAFTQPGKIAFATDLNPGDIALIAILAQFAKVFHAEILILNSYGPHEDAEAHQQRVKNFLLEVTARVNDSHIYFRPVISQKVDEGLDYLIATSQPDMLVMVHRNHNFFQTLVKGSHTQKMADHLKIPLLVLSPEQTRLI